MSRSWTSLPSIGSWLLSSSVCGFVCWRRSLLAQSLNSRDRPPPKPNPHMDPQGTSNHIPSIRKVGALAPFRWLASAWNDMRRAPISLLLYGLVIAALSFALCAMLIVFNAAFWVLVLTSGFVFIAPMLAMGIYEAGRLIELGEKPTLSRMAIVRSAIRQDVAYLGTALLFIYLLWGRIAQVVYGLHISTAQHRFGVLRLCDRHG